MDTIETIEKNKIFGSTTLDIGCGDGTYANYMAQRGSRVDAISPEKVEFNNPNITFFKTNFEDFRIDKTYDVIIARMVIHLIPKDTITAIDMITHYAKPGGYVYFTTFGEEDPWFNKQAGKSMSIETIDDFIKEKGYQVLQKLEHKFSAPTYSGKLKDWHIFEYAIKV